MYEAYQHAEREVSGTGFFLRASNRYPLTGLGRHITSAAVFAEAMRSALSSRGRAGIVAPTEVVTGDTTKHFFEDLVTSRSLVSAYDFQNSLPLFPGVHRGYKFCLLTMTGQESSTRDTEFALTRQDVSDVELPGRKFALSRDDLELLNPNTRTCPIFRSAFDAELTKSIYRTVAILIRHGPPLENPWDISTRPGLFNMSTDSELFHALDEADTRSSGEREFLPLYEAKMFHQFDHRWSHAGGDEAEGPNRLDPNLSLCRDIG